MKHTKDEIEHAKKELCKLVKAGGYKVFTVLRHVSSSGMTRHISLYVATGKGQVRWLDGFASTACGWTMKRSGRDAIVVGGCGMDMGFHLVYELSRVLYPKGFKVKGIGRNGNTSGWDNDGGYKLKQEWI